MNGLTFDATINLGNVIQFLTVVGGVIAAIAIMRNNVREMSNKIEAIQDEMKKMTEIMVNIARQDERMNSLEQRFSDLQRGKGFIFENGDYRKPGGARG